MSTIWELKKNTIKSNYQNKIDLNNKKMKNYVKLFYPIDGLCNILPQSLCDHISITFTHSHCIAAAPGMKVAAATSSDQHRTVHSRRGHPRTPGLLGRDQDMTNVTPSSALTAIECPGACSLRAALYLRCYRKCSTWFGHAHPSLKKGAMPKHGRLFSPVESM